MVDHTAATPSARHAVLLAGCQPEPLAGYLTALGILRAVARQADPEAGGHWATEGFVLTSALDFDGLVQFFAERWEPIPVFTPWNAGAGYFPGETEAALNALLATDIPRLATVRATLQACVDAVGHLGLTEKPKEDAKYGLVAHLRATLPEAGLEWLDAALVLGADGLEFPPLLGTGGNDGKLNFANNHQKQLLTLLRDADDAQRARDLRAALTGAPRPGLANSTHGQFDALSAGGANAGPAGVDEGRGTVDPWRYVLGFEGATLLTATMTRSRQNLESELFAAPFTVRPLALDGSEAPGDEGSGRAELWLPLWSRPTGLLEVCQLFAEGRARVNGRPARNALDFARAIATLGTARGLDAFVRYGIHARNGKQFFAAPLGRVTVPDTVSDAASVLTGLDRWLDRLSFAARSKGIPGWVIGKRHAINRAALNVARRGTEADLRALLVLVGRTEDDVARSPGVRKLVEPLRPLRGAWSNLIGAERTPEGRLALALAARGDLRAARIPLTPQGKWRNEGLDPPMGGRKPVDDLLAWLEAEAIDRSRRARPAALPVAETPDNARDHDDAAAQDTAADDPSANTTAASSPSGGSRARATPTAGAALADIAAFIESPEFDFDAFGDWLAAVARLDPRDLVPTSTDRRPSPDALFALLALAHHRHAPVGRPRLPPTPGMLSRAARGDARGATQLAAQRLRGAGWARPVAVVDADRETTRRAAAALAFPLTAADLDHLARRITRPNEQAQPAHDLTSP